MTGGRAFNVLRAPTPQRGFLPPRPGRLEWHPQPGGSLKHPVYVDPRLWPLTRGLFVINDMSIGTLAAPSPAHSIATSGVVRGVRNVA